MAEANVTLSPPIYQCIQAPAWKKDIGISINANGTECFLRALLSEFDAGNDSAG